MTDTQSRIVPVTGSGVRPPSRAHRFWAIPLAALAVLTLAGVVVAAFVPTTAIHSIKRAYAIVPASAEPVDERLSFSGVERYDSNGAFLFVTIREPELSLLSWLMFRHDQHIDPHTYVELHGEQTPRQQSAAGQVQMVSAKQAAQYVALNKLGYPIDLVPGEIIVDAIVCLKANDAGDKCTEFAPSGKVLQPLDKLLELDGQKIDSVDDIAPLLKSHKPGDLVQVKYNRPGVGDQTGEIEVIAAPGEEDRTIVGFFPVDTTRVGEEPFPVSIDTDGIGGPSAGLAFTLTLIDEVTPGDLTGGNRIAVTGTINVKGNVGAIGGLPQKATAVAQTGTKYFLVPASQSDADIAAARANAPGVQIIPVATLDDALKELAKLGGNADSLGTPGKDFTPED